MRANKAPRNSGQLREYLLTLIPKVMDGSAIPDRVNAMAKLAEKVNGSLKVETDADRFLLSAGKTPYPLGRMPLGDDDGDGVDQA